MKTKDLHILFDELSHTSRQEHILTQIREMLPSAFDEELVSYLNDRKDIRQLIIEKYLGDCRYMIRLFSYNTQEFMFEEYARIVQVSTDLFRLEELLKHEMAFGEFKTALSAALKSKSFRAGFRQEYFSLSNSNRSHVLETLL